MATEGKLTAASLLPQLRMLNPGDRLVIDSQVGYLGRPVYIDDVDRSQVLHEVNRLVAQGYGLVFHRRITHGRESYIVREFVAVRPETSHKLKEALERVKLPAKQKTIYDFASKIG